MLLPKIVVLLTFSYIDESNIFSFIQISDTHLSHNPTSMSLINFRIFTSTIVPAFNPDVVVHTGDITDGWIDGLMSILLFYLLL